jgi:hypothetical protein
MVPEMMRHRARRPRYGLASRLVTCACRTAPSVYSGAGMVLKIVSKRGCKFSESGKPPSSGLFSEARPALAAQ